MADLQGVSGKAPWDAATSGKGPRTASEYSRSKDEWMPRPIYGRGMPTGAKKIVSPEPIYVQVVPGPERTWQIVRVDLAKPVARGFRTKKGASRWIESAVGKGILPGGTTELEPAT